jgi:hypothetical protein
MNPATKKSLKVAGGVAIGAGLLFLILRPSTAAGAGSSGGGTNGIAAPTASDSDIGAVADKALAIETEPTVLRQLATAMMVIPYSNPLHNKIGLLQQRADAIEANAPSSAVSSGGASETFAHIKQF